MMWGKNVRDAVSCRSFSVSHGSLSTLLQHMKYLPILPLFTTRCLVLIPSLPAVSPCPSYLLPMTYLFFQETVEFQSLEKSHVHYNRRWCSIQQPWHSLQSAYDQPHPSGPGDATPSPHKKLLTIGSSGRTHPHSKIKDQEEENVCKDTTRKSTTYIFYKAELKEVMARQQKKIKYKPALFTKYVE